MPGPADLPPVIDPRWRFQPRGQGFDATGMLHYEFPLEDSSYLEVWCYTDAVSYLPGETVQVHASATAKSVSLELLHDTLRPRVVARADGLSVPLTKLAPGYLENGCGWPVVHRFTLPADAPSGFYLLIARATDAAGNVREHEHGFFVRARRPTAPVLLLSATGTWIAYNDWGGANHYVGDTARGCTPPALGFAPRLTIHRPWARGQVFLPIGAPRKTHEHEVPPGSIPRYPPLEFAFARGYSRWYANAGWAIYERPFAVWAQQQGIGLDYATAFDLQADPALLDGYRCVVMVGHDEYWTWDMREAVDRFVERGGHAARFAGNFHWQCRIEDGGNTQVCYKLAARAHDPLANTRRITANWEDAVVGWPGAATFGLNSCYGIYAGVGSMVPRGTRGFTVYRPDHWSLADTDLYYGDLLGGGAAHVFGYEVDGLDYTMRDGLPYPTFSDGAPESTKIIAMGLAVNTEVTRGRRHEVSYYGEQAPDMAKLRYGNDTDENVEKASRGSGMMVEFTRGAGSVFHAGSCEWVSGFVARDHGTETVTRNVLERFSRS